MSLTQHPAPYMQRSLGLAIFPSFNVTQDICQCISISVGELMSTWFLFLRLQAGTYIKEFCHGDLGRSTPSVAEILGPAEPGGALPR